MVRLTQILSSTTIFFLLSIQSLSAQIAVENLPDMSALREVFGSVADGSQKIETITNQEGLIGSGIAVPDTGARGKIAKEIAQGLATASGDPEMADAFEPIFVQIVQETEGQLAALGFQKRDYGVGYAFFFLLSWQIANEVDLPQDIVTPTATQLVQTIQASYGNLETPLSAEELDTQYDLMLTVPLAILSLVQIFEQNDQPDTAAAMREMAGQTFEQVLGISPYDIDITEEGIKGYK